jgi:hypothetical protein
MTQPPEYVDLSLITTPTPSVTPTPSPTSNPIVGWLQNNLILTAVLLLLLIFFFMMGGISFPSELVGGYVSRVVTLGKQAKGNMSIIPK